MNFFSDHIINDIIDKCPLEELIDKVDDFKALCQYCIIKYSAYSISHKYTTSLLNDEKNIVAFYCMDNEFSIGNCPSMLIYRKYKYGNNIRYYILFACTARKFRGQGFASKLIDGLVLRIKEENQDNKDKDIKIVLSSIESAVLFYEDYGFRWTKETLFHHPRLLLHEKYEEHKEYFIMELKITP